MSLPLEELEAHALQLPPLARGQLAARLLQSLEPEPEDTPENIEEAWDEVIKRRLDELDRGLVEPVPYEQVRAELKALIAAQRGR